MWALLFVNYINLSKLLLWRLCYLIYELGRNNVSEDFWRIRLSINNICDGLYRWH